jgi:hypothetical protein
MPLISAAGAWRKAAAHLESDLDAVRLHETSRQTVGHRDCPLKADSRAGPVGDCGLGNRLPVVGGEARVVRGKGADWSDNLDLRVVCGRVRHGDQYRARYRILSFAETGQTASDRAREAEGERAP